jgi:glycosyltransferase involved in cell wall biosynthesis
MKVSVCITTYNHRPFIAQALDGVLFQQVDFDYEILLGEDDSSDGTRQIAEEYAARHSDRIRLFLHDRKDVLFIDGRPTGRRNFVNNIEQARGDYIALLDGDDYWIDPRKLQKQVDFLDRHPQTAICFHAAQGMNLADFGQNYVLRPPGRQSFYTLRDLLRENLIPSCTTMFRRGLFGAFPDWFYRTSTADWPLHVLNAMHGNLGYLDEVMAVYRIHPGGIWMGWPLAKRLQGVINSCREIANHLPAAERKILDRTAFAYSLQLAEELLILGDRRQARQTLLQGRMVRSLASGGMSKYLSLVFAANGLSPQRKTL